MEIAHEEGRSGCILPCWPAPAAPGPLTVPEIPLLLKSLDISGFKSFARPTRLEFPPGITALVGPNGSGKSNVVDAVRWCLGEQSMRDLRGQRAEDVIYAGARKVHGLADVALTFETGPTDTRFSWTELCVSRRLYRSGESEYLLNRSKARLKDITGALREIGIDAGRHVVVTQGMADSLLAASPADRRALLEQAAGLAGYRDRRDDARHKLATTQQNIETIEAVLAELEPRLKLLRRQARAVEEREQATQYLQQRLTAWYAASWRASSLMVARLSADTRQSAGERAACMERLQEAEDAIQHALDRERGWYQRLEAATAALHQTERERDESRHRVEQLQHRLLALQRSQSEARDRVRREAENHEAAVSRLAGAEQSLATLHKQLSDLTGQSAVAAETTGALKERLAALEQDAAGHRTALTQALGRQQSLEHQMSAAEREGEEARRRREEAATWLRQTEVALSDLEKEASKLQALLSRAEQAEDEAFAGLRLVQSDVGRQRRSLGRLDRLRDLAQERVHRTSSALSTAQKTLHALALDGENRILNRLIVAVGWEVAVASALQDALPSLARRDAPEMPSAGPPTAYEEWRSDITRQLGNGCIWADDVTQSPDGFVCQRLAATLLVADAESASDLWLRLAGRSAHTIASPPVQVVARTGQRFSWLGREEPPEDKTVRFLMARAETAVLGGRLPSQQRRLELLREAYASSAASLTEQEQRARKQEAGVEQAQARRRELIADRERVERRRERLLAEREERQREVTSHHSAVLEAERRRDSLRHELAVHANELQERRKRHDDASGEVETVRRQLSRKGAQADALRREMALVEAKWQGQADYVAALRRELERASRQREELSAAARRDEQQEADFAADIVQAQEKLGKLTTIWSEQTREIELIRRQKPEAGDSHDVTRALRERLAVAVSRHEKLLAESSLARERAQDLAQHIYRDLGVHPDDLPEQGVDAPGEDEIRRLRVRAAQYADLDASVVQEYRGLEERRDGLRSHIEDLVEAAGNLDEIMRRADAEMRVRFQMAFAAVSEEFSRVFRIMLRGGDASLEQIEGESGIEIHARLPGKRSRSSAAFSGGERALVASSLLFGVLKIRPAPFCILDEVDAALDESNVDRYLHVLREISRETQIIVVTHNRATMAEADVLYGLTMDDDGASSVLSLRLDAYGAAG